MKTIKVVPRGKKRRLSLQVFETVNGLPRKQSCVVTKVSWKLKETPNAHLFRRYLKKEFFVQSLASGKGWLVTRK